LIVAVKGFVPLVVIVRLLLSLKSPTLGLLRKILPLHTGVGLIVCHEEAIEDNTPLIVHFGEALMQENRGISVLIEPINVSADCCVPSFAQQVTVMLAGSRHGALDKDIH
jgi:hypothetical protein